MPMLTTPANKYRSFPKINLPDRHWPNCELKTAPRWLSTDLRDGNQALMEPMGAEKKSRLFNLLTRMGFKEIEIGFPSAGKTEFDFTQDLIRSNNIPTDVLIQVLTQARHDLIKTTFESLSGARAAIVHLYNAVSPLWRDIVFAMGQEQVKDMAVSGAKALRDQAARFPHTQWHFEYSPETFSTAELDFSIECCEAVMDVLRPTAEWPIILNLPATIEAATPNVYADQIEYFCRNLAHRERAVISLHTHNDRGTGVAAAELGLMAGADRVEGCLFGNGERTGNCCLVTMALNLYTQGVDPKLDFSDIDEVIKTAEYCTQLPVHERHPYAGKLVFTAFSGSHQDAIKKGFSAQARRNDEIWAIPYLPIDTADVGRDYEAVIRVNSQSGKGGFAWVLEQDRKLRLPKRMQAHFSEHVQEIADQMGRELLADDIWAVFKRVYRLDTVQQHFRLEEHEEKVAADGARIFAGKIRVQGEVKSVGGRGNGVLSSVIATLDEAFGLKLEIRDYSEHAMAEGSDAPAVAYIECATPAGMTIWGVGIDEDVAAAGVRAVLSAANAAIAK